MTTIVRALSALLAYVRETAIGRGGGKLERPRGGGNRLRRTVFAFLLCVGPFTSAYAQDSASGEKAFAQCRVCHQVGETAKNAVGPTLNGLFGRKAGTVEGYKYSAANQASGIVWDEATFAEYIKDPKAKIPGTKMVFAGVKDEKRIRDLIAFLKQFDASGKRTK